MKGHSQVRNVAKKEKLHTNYKASHCVVFFHCLSLYRS